MPLEIATYISGLNSAWPVGASDIKGQGDDHLRLIKSTLQSTLPNLTGAMTLTHTQLNQAAIKNEANVFTNTGTRGGAPIKIENANPALALVETDGAADAKGWDFLVNGGVLAGRTHTDANTAGAEFLRVTRSGVNISQIDLQVNINDNAIRCIQGGAVELYHNDSNRLATDSTGINVRADSDTRLNFFTQDGLTRRGFIRQTASNNQWRSEINGATLLIDGNDSGGVVRNVITGDPNGSVGLYYNGLLRAVTEPNRFGIRNDANADSTNLNVIQFEWQNGTSRGYIGHLADDNFRVSNLIHGRPVILGAENASGVLHDMVWADPDDAVYLYYNNESVFQTVSSGAKIGRSALAQNMDLTIDAAAGQRTALKLREGNTLGFDLMLYGDNADNDLRIVRVNGATNEWLLRIPNAATEIITPNLAAGEFGFKGCPVNTQNGSYTFGLSDAGKAIRKTSGGSGETYTVPANSSVAFPVGTVIVVWNNGGGDLTIASSDIMVGLGGLGTGSRTLANAGKAVLEKVDTTRWWISGIGLS